MPQKLPITVVEFLARIMWMKKTHKFVAHKILDTGENAAPEQHSQMPVFFANSSGCLGLLAKSIEKQRLTNGNCTVGLLGGKCGIDFYIR